MTASLSVPAKRWRSYAVALAVMIVALAGYLPFAPVRLFDFRAFYCAGKSISADADPYREHPLHECERASRVPGMSVDRDNVTVPAPLPGYALALFAVLSKLPFGMSVLVWIAASLTAAAAASELLRRTLNLSRPTVGIAILLPATVVAIPLGQPAPFVCCAIALCAYGLVHGKPRLAAASALVTAFDPAIAIVLCATLFVAVPAARLTIIGGTIALIVLSIGVLGIERNGEYLGAVLREHAAGSVGERSQFSTTHFVWIAGVPAAQALSIGKIWFAIAALAGIATAVRLRLVYGPVALALVPPAFAVFGGLYVHYSQLVLAIPAYLMVLQSASAHRAALSNAIFILAVPWLALTAFPPFAVGLVAAATLYAREECNAAATWRLGLAAAATLVCFFGVALLSMHDSLHTFAFIPSGNPLAEIGWSRYVAWRDAGPEPVVLLVQSPTVSASAFCLALLVRAGFRARCAGAVSEAPALRR